MRTTYDVIIAGGGVIGASIAWRLARNNFRVLLLDAAKIGAEASSAAAGMLAPAGEFDDPSMLDFASRSLAAYPEFVRSIEADGGLAIEFRKTTAVEIALTNTGLSKRSRAPIRPPFLPATNSARLFRWSASTPSAPCTTPTKPSSIPPA